MMIVFLFLMSLLQTFCYGAKGIQEEENPRVVTVPEAKRPLDRIVTVGGMKTFVYECCETPFIDELRTHPPAENVNFGIGGGSTASPPARKTFIVCAPLIGSAVEVILNFSHANLHFVSSKKRFLTEQDFENPIFETAIDSFFKETKDLFLEIIKNEKSATHHTEAYCLNKIARWVNRKHYTVSVNVYLTQEGERALERVITEGGVSPFVYQYFQKFYEEFQEKGVDLLPNRSEVAKLVAWSQKYFALNHLKLTPEASIPFVDDELIIALRTLPPAENINFGIGGGSTASPPARKTFVVCEPHIGSAVAVILACSYADLHFFCSQDRVLTEKDFKSPVFETEGHPIYKKIKGFFRAIMDKKGSCPKYPEKITEFYFMQQIARWVNRHSHDSVELFLHPVTKGNDPLIQCVNHLSSPSVDGVVSAYPFSLALQKIATHELKRHVPFYDVYPPTSNLEILQALSYTLYTEKLLNQNLGSIAMISRPQPNSPSLEALFKLLDQFPI